MRNSGEIFVKFLEVVGNKVTVSLDSDQPTRLILRRFKTTDGGICVAQALIPIKRLECSLKYAQFAGMNRKQFVKVKGMKRGTNRRQYNRQQFEHEQCKSVSRFGIC